MTAGVPGGWWRLSTPGSGRFAVSIADGCVVVIGIALIAVPAAYLWTDLTYDEAVYLRLARTIAECGLPLRRAYADFNYFRLFENSPPLVMYIAAVSQSWFPGQELPARLVHLAAFVLPTYVLVWWVAREHFGAWAGVASLAALLTSGSYMRMTSHVLLDIPLGFLGCLALVAFYHASSVPIRRRSWLLALAITTVLMVWTKYQAICVGAAIVAVLIHTAATDGSHHLRSMRVALLTTIASAGTALLGLVGFLWAFGGRDGLTATMELNAERIRPASMSIVEIGRAVVATARECDSTLGAAVLLLAALAVCAEHRHRRLVLLLGSYVGITIAFNLTLFRLPGAGSSYLYSAVPALAIVAGPGAVRLIGVATTRASGTILAAAAVVIQLVDSGSLSIEYPRPNGSRVAAAYVAAHSPSTAGVVADTVAIEFYSGHPVRPVSFTFPKEMILRSLDGTSGDDITYVVIDSRAAPKNIDSIRERWDALLAEHFELVSAGAPGLRVFQRRRR
jgi:hypothetical protein